MHSKVIVAAIAALPLAFAAPSRLPEQYFKRFLNETNNNTATYGPPDSVSTCDLTNVVQPVHTLAAPSADLKLILLAHGEGTQNYTCGTNLTAPPSLIGAVATLWDASCGMTGNSGAAKAALGSINEASAIGNHFFVDTTTPDFNIDNLGNTQTKKAEECPAPKPATDIKWLRLVAQAAGTTSPVKEVYRLSTVGGLAPTSCEGRRVGEIMTVAYQAQYWFYAEAADPKTATTEAPSASQSQKPALEQFQGGASGRLSTSLNLCMVIVALSMYSFLW